MRANVSKKYTFKSLCACMNLIHKITLGCKNPSERKILYVEILSSLPTFDVELPMCNFILIMYLLFLEVSETAKKKNHFLEFIM